MQGYAPAEDGAFAESWECFGGLIGWAASEETAGLQHADLEEQLQEQGRKLLRQLLQDRLELTAAREKRRHDVTGADGIVRTRAERGRTRPLMTVLARSCLCRRRHNRAGGDGTAASAP
jgi:hypothetical protein